MVNAYEALLTVFGVVTLAVASTSDDSTRTTPGADIDNLELCKAAKAFVGPASVHPDGIRLPGGFTTEWIDSACAEA